MGRAASEHTGIVLGEYTLVGDIQTADKGKAELTAVGVTRKSQIHTKGHIFFKQLRSVGEQDGVRILLHQRLKPICNGGIKIKGRIVNTGKADRLPLLFEGNGFVSQHRYADLPKLCKQRVVVHTVFVIAADIVGRGDLHSLTGKLQRLILGGIVNDVAGNDDDVGGQGGDLLR